MYKNIIKKYIKNINLSDINSFALKHNISLTNDEANIIYNYIKNDYETILYGDSTNIFNELKTKLDEDKYIKISNLFNEFKNKYKIYL